MESLWSRLLRLIYGVIIGWLIALVRLLDELAKRRQRKDRLRREREIYAHCQPIPPAIYKRPDPLIYCQNYLMSLGLGVTWDNPDIQVYEILSGGGRGAPISSHALQPSVEYEVEATIYNGSTVAPAVNMPVEFSYLSFGVGTQSHPIGATSVDLPVKGAPGHPAKAVQRWRTPDRRGHFCIQVKLIWADDANPNNNLGQENVDVGTAASPALFEFAVGNPTQAARIVRFEADAYELAALPPCEAEFDAAALGHQRGRVLSEDERAARRALTERRARPHLRGAHPLPRDWRISLDPDRAAVEPNAEVTVRVLVTPPDGWKGRQNVNVNGFDEAGRFVGGVTLKTERT
jgi:hypothetical protein